MSKRGAEWSQATSVTTRRDFLRSMSVGAVGLTAALLLPSCGTDGTSTRDVAEPAGWLPGAYVRIGRDNSTLIRVNRPEMGQGTWTSMPMLISEELDVDWSCVEVEWAPVEPPFANPGFYGTEWSSAVRDMFVPLRQVGAGLRQLFVSAAAKRWRMAHDLCRTENGFVIDSTGSRRIAYGQLIDDLRAAELPAAPALKKPGDFRLLGKHQPNRLTSAVSEGKAVFGLDVRVPQCLIAVVIRPPNLRAQFLRCDTSPATAMKGVHKIVEIPSGIAVVAENFWLANKASAALKPEWDLGTNATVSSQSIRARLKSSLDETPTFVPLEDPQVEERLRSADGSVVHAEYEVPYQAHAAMEPTCCIANVEQDVCELWMATQNPPHVRSAVAHALGIEETNIRFHPQLMGGSFGRKYEPDPATDAALLSRMLQRPIKTMWTREDEIQFGPHRPVQVGRVGAHIGSDGIPDAFEIRMAGPSYFLRKAADLDRLRQKENGFDSSTFESVCPLPYPVPMQRLAQHWVDFGITIGSWRSTAHSMNLFFLESFVDELAVRQKEDPIAYRIRWLRGDRQLPSERIPKNAFAPKLDRERMIRVLERVREVCGWQNKQPTHGLGVAMQFGWNGYAALVAEVEINAKNFRVARMWFVADVGQVVNPNSVDQQLRGGLIMGLTATIKSGLSIRDGRVEQTNFNDFELLRMNEIPDISIDIIESGADPGGVGEAGVPLAAPAVANAIYAASGQRLRRLPIRFGDLQANDHSAA